MLPLKRNSFPWWSGFFSTFSLFQRVSSMGFFRTLSSFTCLEQIKAIPKTQVNTTVSLQGMGRGKDSKIPSTPSWYTGLLWKWSENQIITCNEHASVALKAGSTVVLAMFYFLSQVVGSFSILYTSLSVS